MSLLSHRVFCTFQLSGRETWQGTWELPSVPLPSLRIHKLRAFLHYLKTGSPLPYRCLSDNGKVPLPFLHLPLQVFRFSSYLTLELFSSSWWHPDHVELPKSAKQASLFNQTLPTSLSNTLAIILVYAWCNESNQLHIFFSHVPNHICVCHI